MIQATKHCDLTVHLKSGIEVSGRFHVPSEISPVVRPFDAIRDCTSSFLLLSDAIVTAEGNAKNHRALTIRFDAIAYIELPEGGWNPSEPPCNKNRAPMMQR